jgi:uncharacterized protein (DUF305 family)
LAASVIFTNDKNLATSTVKQVEIPQNNTLDQHFIEQMIPHHEDAVTMANLALEKAKKPEIKTLAANIIKAQEEEINSMRNWYKQWFGREIPVGQEVMQQHGMMGISDMHMGMMGNNSDISRLQTAADFDKGFIEHMIPHHQMAVMMASMLKDGSTRAEMKQLADNIIVAQTKEIDMMRGWYNEWYDQKLK